MTVTRYELTVYVETLSPLHSGGTDEAVDRSQDDRTSVPRAFARDGHGHPVLTGRSVKGALRAAWQRYCEDAASVSDGPADHQSSTGDKRSLARLLWGGTTRNKADRTEEEVLRAGALTFHPVILEDAAEANGHGKDPERDGAPGADGSKTGAGGSSAGLYTRAGIAVDRYWGTAGSTALFQHEYVPAGRLLELRITAQAGEMPQDSHHDSLPRPWSPGAVTEKQVEQLLADILGLLKAGLVAFGGRKGAGWGRVQLATETEVAKMLNAQATRTGPRCAPGGTDPGSDSEVKPYLLTRFRLGSRQDLLDWLAGGEDITGRIAEDVEKSAKAVEAASSRVRIQISWGSPTGILVAEPSKEPSAQDPQDPQSADTEGTTGTRGAQPPQGRQNNRQDGGTAAGRAKETERTPVPTLPLRSNRLPIGDTAGEETKKTRKNNEEEREDPLVLPGSSVRGALRSRASRIARTVLAAHGCNKFSEDAWQDTNVHSQLAEDPPLVRDLFGSTEHRGALTVLDTEARENGTPRTVTHNAGDRWTGGAAGGALYSEKVYDNALWNDIVLEVDLEALRSNPGRDRGRSAGGSGSAQASEHHSQAADPDSRCRAAWCLLGLTLAELAAGTLPLGSRSTRGMGQVRVSRLRVSGGKGSQGIVGDLPWDLAAPDDDVPGASSLARQVLARLQEASTGIVPQANSQGLTGWSSYLVDPEEEGQRQ